MLEQVREISLLYDFYGELLPERQREIVRLYHEDNFSLAEIGAEFGITRQGVHEALKRALERLAGFEEKLGLVRRFTATEETLEAVRSQIEALLAKSGGDPKLADALRAMRQAIDGLEQEAPGSTEERNGI